MYGRINIMYNLLHEVESTQVCSQLIFNLLLH